MNLKTINLTRSVLDKPTIKLSCESDIATAASWTAFFTVCITDIFYCVYNGHRMGTIINTIV